MSFRDQSRDKLELLVLVLGPPVNGHGAPLGDGLRDHRPEFELLQGALSAPQYYLILFWKMNFCH